MSLTAWKTSQTQENETGADSNSWGTMSNVAASDDNYSACSIGKNEVSDFFNAKNFGFSIPANATIDGITVRIETKSSATNTLKDQTIQLLVGGSRSGDNKAISDYYPTSDITRDYGGDSDKWGLNISPSDINSSDFGISIQYYADGGSATAYIDYIAIQVSYTGGGNYTTTHDTKVITSSSIEEIYDSETCVSYQGGNEVTHIGTFAGNEQLDNDEIMNFAANSEETKQCEDNNVYIYAWTSRPVNGNTYYAVFNNFDFCIPEDATINGVKAKIRQAKYSDTQDIAEYAFKLRKNSTLSNNKADTNHHISDVYTNSYENRIVGGENDTWGLTLTPADINDTDFSLLIKYTVIDNGDAVYYSIIDCVTLTIYYTVGVASYMQTYDTKTKIITTIKISQDTKTIINKQYLLNQDAKEIVKTLVSSISDTSASILTNLLQLYDTNSNISNLITNLQDTQTNVSLLVSSIHDTEVQISTHVLYTQLHNTLTVVKNTIKTLQDTHSAVSSTYKDLFDTKSNVSLFKLVTHDTKNLILTAIKNIYDTASLITNLITEITDILTTVSTSVEISQDIKAIILTSIDETFDTLISLTNLIKQLHDTQAQVSVPLYEIYHDTLAQVTTSINKLIDSKAVVSNLYENLTDTFVLIKTSRTIVQDTSLSITTQLTKLFDSYTKVSSLFEQIHDTKTIAKFSIEEYFDSYTRVTTEILNRADLEADVSTKIDLSQDTKVISKTLLVYFNDTKLTCIDHPIVTKLFKLADRLNKLKTPKPRIKCFKVANRVRVFEVETRPKVFKLPNRKFLYNNR